jgi:hypothetical protein
VCSWRGPVGALPGTCSDPAVVALILRSMVGSGHRVLTFWTGIVDRINGRGMNLKTWIGTVAIAALVVGGSIVGATIHNGQVQADQVHTAQVKTAAVAAADYAVTVAGATQLSADQQAAADAQAVIDAKAAADALAAQQAAQAAAAQAAQVAAQAAAVEAPVRKAARATTVAAPVVGPIRCPAGSSANSGDAGNGTSCFPDICFHIALSDVTHPECVTPFKPRAVQVFSIVRRGLELLPRAGLRTVPS